MMMMGGTENIGDGEDVTKRMEIGKGEGGIVMKTMARSGLDAGVGAGHHAHRGRDAGR